MRDAVRVRAFAGQVPGDRGWVAGDCLVAPKVPAIVPTGQGGVGAGGRGFRIGGGGRGLPGALAKEIFAVPFDLPQEGVVTLLLFLMEGLGPGAMQAAAGVRGLPRGATALFPGLALGAHGVKPLIAGPGGDGRVGGGGRPGPGVLRAPQGGGQ